MDNPHSCIANVHVITTTFSSYVSTPLGAIFLDLVFLFRWSTRELIRMFHDLLALLMEFFFLWITFIASFNAWFIHIPLKKIGGIQFSFGVDILFCGWKVGGRFSLLVPMSTACKSNILFRFLRGTIKFMITYIFLDPASNNLVECILAPPRLCLLLPCKQPRNLENVVNLEILLYHVLRLI